MNDISTQEQRELRKEWLKTLDELETISNKMQMSLYPNVQDMETDYSTRLTEMKVFIKRMKEFGELLSFLATDKWEEVDQPQQHQSQKEE